MKQSRKLLLRRRRCVLMIMSIITLGWGLPTQALDLDWSGQFTAESHWVYNYSLDSGNILHDTSRSTADGYYIPGGGQSNALFQNLFLKLRPSLIVNDNIYIKSEWWLGDPIFGFYGSSSPYPAEQRQFYSNQSRGSAITAQRVWAEFLSNIGTVQAGRMPLHWGLGVVWNSGDDLWSRYSTTGDGFRLVSKFGSFSFAPGLIKYSEGNNIGGGCTDPSGSPVCSTVGGGGGVADYSLILKYENLDEDIELGLNFIRRIAGAGQDSSAGYFGINGATAGMGYNTWDVYGKKTLGDFTFAGELPIATGNIGGVNYNTFALALEAKWQATDKIQTHLKAGHVPGQPNIIGSSPDTFKAFYFNPNYKLGLIMFNYQLRNFVGPNTVNNPTTTETSLVSPYDNPLTNANYIALGGSLKLAKWLLRMNWIWAKAIETASSSSSKFYNTWSREFVDFDKNLNGGVSSQGSSLGWEIDFGTTFHWDESFQFDFDFGWWFPGDYYKFSNTSFENLTSPTFATVFKAGVKF